MSFVGKLYSHLFPRGAGPPGSAYMQTQPIAFSPYGQLPVVETDGLALPLTEYVSTSL